MKVGNRTFSMIKPDATKICAVSDRKEAGFMSDLSSKRSGSITGMIINAIEEDGFEIIGQKRIIMTRQIAEGFYSIHKDKGFFQEMVSEITSGPVLALALEAEDAVAKYRKLIGNTDPKKADRGTIRNKYGLDIGRNSVHGSDTDENAATEIGFFFAGYELL